MSKPKQRDGADDTRPVPVAASGVAMHGRYFPPKVEGLDGLKATFPLDTVQGKAALVNAGSPGTLSIGSDGRLRLRVCDALCYWDTSVDENTGEISEFVRTILYTPDGATFKTSSPHAPHFVARLVDVFGIECLRAGIPITICERQSKRDRRVYHDFRIELEEQRQ